MAFRILLVDDDPDVLDVLEQILEFAGYLVTTADSVAGALALLTSPAYDLVLTDLRLGDGLGTIIAEKAAATGAKPLIITGYAYDLAEDERIRYDYLQKPVFGRELIDAVERALDLRPG